MAKKPHRHPQVPLFNAPILDAIAVALGRRLKAIRSRSADARCSREAEDIVDERLDIDVDLRRSRGAKVRLSVWPDGVMWLGLHVPNERSVGGWRTSITLDGDVAGMPPEAVVQLLEQTLSEVWRSNLDEGHIREIWGDNGR